MNELMQELFCSPYFGIAITIVAFRIGGAVQKKTGLVICNSMLITVFLLIGFLTVFHIPYEDYFQGGRMIDMMLGPVTACMAVTIYRKRELLMQNLLPVLLGCLAGAVTSIVSIYGMSKLFGLDLSMTVSMLPKSVTTPIAVAISEGHGGIPPITVAAVVVTGILGNLLAPVLIKVFRVKDPLAAGLGIGACSHAVGTAKAMEIGETEGAMSGLAIGICGIFTAALALGFELFL